MSSAQLHFKLDLDTSTFSTKITLKFTVVINLTPKVYTLQNTLIDT